jgi:hypothetical protein
MIASHHIHDKSHKRKERRIKEFPRSKIGLRYGFDCDDLTAFVETTSRAHAVWNGWLSALRAFAQLRQG